MTEIAKQRYRRDNPENQREHYGENTGGRDRVSRAMVKAVRTADQHPGQKIEVGRDGGEERQYRPPSRKHLARFWDSGYREGKQDMSNRTWHGSESCRGKT
jgi:hypothetical protein